jgi:hypothetical protein
MIPLEDLKLDDYEYDDLESFVYFTDAVAEAKQLKNFPNEDSDDSVPKDIIDLQLHTLCGEH